MKNNIIRILRSKEYQNIFIILVLILSVRCFILEPFRIPSGSMQPTILIGDFIFVNKFLYNLNIPIINKKIKTNKPERGDIIIFKSKNNKNYIKRVIGISDDKIYYTKKKLYINDKLIKNKYKCKKINFNKNNIIIETHLKKEYLNPKKEYYIQVYNNLNNPKYTYSNIKVPENAYFVLGDNRDNSEDSRFWGFVEEKNIIGKALIIWMSVDYKIIDIRWNRFLKVIK